VTSARPGLPLRPAPWLLALIALLCSAHAAAHPSTTVDAKVERAAILAVIQNMQDAWNRGDFRGYMQGFKQPDVIFVSNGRFQDGWQGTLDHYIRDYGASAAARGALRFYDIQVEMLAPDAAQLISRYELIRPHRPQYGINTRLMRKVEGRWVIALNHVSASETPPASSAADFPAPAPGEHVIRDFRFASGETLPELRIHYRTLGKLQRGPDGVARNAVLILHGTGGDGERFVRGAADLFAGQLFGRGQPLDAERYYIVIPDNIGHGESSKPSDGLRAKFPRYGYRDMIEAQRRLLLEHLDVNHLRLVLGTSMGGMHTWLWGQMHPHFMDGLVPLASLPSQISGRNRMWRSALMDAIRLDPAWRGGDYAAQPGGLRTALQISYLMGGNPTMRQQAAPTLGAADKVFDEAVAASLKTTDANDYLYAFDASHDYDPAPGLERIRAPLLAINFADDLINPPELGILEREIVRVKRGRALTVPASAETVGHSTHTKAAVWRRHLEDFMATLPPPGAQN
jgi:homoserine O-acetyltransferase/O-succinyltransferase